MNSLNEQVNKKMYYHMFKKYTELNNEYCTRIGQNKPYYLLPIWLICYLWSFTGFIGQKWPINKSFDWFVIGHFLMGQSFPVILKVIKLGLTIV